MRTSTSWRREGSLPLRPGDARAAAPTSLVTPPGAPTAPDARLGGTAGHRNGGAPSKGRRREVSSSIAAITRVAAGRSAGQSHSRGHAVPGVRRSPAEEPVAANPTMRQTTRGALGEGGDVAAPLGGEAGDQGGVEEVGAVLRCVLGLSGAGDEHRAHGSSIPRRRPRSRNGFHRCPSARRRRPARRRPHARRAGAPSQRSRRSPPAYQRTVPENMGRRTWAGEHGLGERARLVIGEDGGLRRRREVDAEDRARRPDDGTTSGPARVAPQVAAGEIRSLRRGQVVSR